ncbi:glycoside hydrolase family 43 protein [Hymenobacter caeli]|uniref:Beta-xylosidase n=1 Tax=Hymenobacter caeli TaxID=2735894 RepID=A0ABX2FRJ3_9BACT|nr:glycoside hydrolase family 43 protein [Hymenobacter caeli]NRT19443.1 beta-xylosidase [Hymenobacter caeli]
MKKLYWLAGLLALGRPGTAQTGPPAPPTSGNPVLPGWYADPEAAIFGQLYWIYPTFSAVVGDTYPANEAVGSRKAYAQQVFLDAFSSPDLVTWTKHPHVLDTASVHWARRAVWAPAIVAKGGQYFLFFGANDIQNDRQRGGIGVARADNPAGPFRDYLGHPLVDKFYNGAQPIDQFVFRDVNGKYYLVYGGWQHCNIAQLKDDFTGFVPFADGTTFRAITPPGYVEGPVMFRRQGKYYFMWSEGDWTGPSYAVAYAVGTSPFGPFRREGKVLQQDAAIGTGAGHHSVLQVPGTDDWYLVYHRRPPGDAEGNHRVVCIDRMEFDAAGHIRPVRMTTQGVAPRPLR